MNEERKRKFRLQKDALFNRAARETALFLILPVLLPVTILGVLILIGHKGINTGYLIAILSSFAIYLSTVFSLLFIVRQAKSSARKTLQAIKIEAQKIGSIVDGKLSTTVDSLTGLLQLIEAMADAYESALDETDNSTRTSSNMIAVVRKHEDLFEDASPPNIAVHYFGAATITPTEEQIKDSEALEDYRASPVERFREVNNELHDLNIGIRRYIRFFDLPGFERRTPTVRATYIKWLENQVKLLEDNENYCLVNARRAPRFLALRNFVITHDTYIGILGKGESGFRVNGNVFAERQLEGALDYIRSNVTSWPVVHNKTRGLNSIKKYLEELIECHEETLATEARPTEEEEPEN